MTTSVLNQIFKNKFKFPEKKEPVKSTITDQIKVNSPEFTFKPFTTSSEVVGELLTETPAPFTFSGNPPNVEVESVSLFGGQVTITR